MIDTRYLRFLSSGVSAYPAFVYWPTLVLILIWTGATAFGQPADLTQLSLEELMKIPVTSVAKHEEQLLETAAAAFVITQEDIRRSGARSVPDALRLAPGVEVAQINGNSWAIAIRGFNNRYSNKLLVMIDGRTIYTTAFSGVFWDLRDLPLEDIDRIEVIRGPGGALWGANAMNGVIHIITKMARHTQGGLISAAGASQADGSAFARYGSKTGDGFFYRLYGKYSHFGETPSLQAPERNAHDAWEMLRGGFRADWTRSSADSFSFSGDLYRGSEEQTYTMPLLLPPFSDTRYFTFVPRGGDLLATWKHDFRGGSQAALKIYYDQMNYPSLLFAIREQICDIDFQHHTFLGPRQEFIWGLGYRATAENGQRSVAVSWNPSHLTLGLYNAFVQDEIRLWHDRAWLTAGSKIEYNEFTGFEVEPSLRLRYRAHRGQMLWAAASRAIRTPSNFEEIGRVDAVAFPGPGGTPMLLSLVGNKSLGAEDLLAYEGGYRVQVTPKLALDGAAFYNLYHNLIYGQVGQPFLENLPAPPHVVLPAVPHNYMTAHSHGLELWASYAPIERWKLIGTYSWLRSNLSASTRPDTPFVPGDSPRHQFQVRSYFSLPHNLEFDNSIFYVGKLAAQPVSSYVRWDTRFGWHATENVDASIGGQNLLTPRRAEFVQSSDVLGPAQVGRVVYGKVTWHF